MYHETVPASVPTTITWAWEREVLKWTREETGVAGWGGAEVGGREGGREGGRKMSTKQC